MPLADAIDEADALFDQTVGSSKACPKTGKRKSIPKGCEYLNKPYTVEAPKKNFDNIRKKAKLSKPVAGKHKFPGDAAESDALVYEVEVKGRKVKVIAPKNGAPKGKSLPTPAQVSNALGCVPNKQLESITQVVISPNQNPSDAYWARQYGIKDFSSAATGGKGGVTFYPKTTAYDQAFVDSTMIHEGGHAYSGDLWKDESAKKAWQEAIKKDGVAPSKYAESAATEDFSESLVMYSLSKGTKCESAAKKRYPERYKILDEMFKEKK